MTDNVHTLGVPFDTTEFADGLDDVRSGIDEMEAGVDRANDALAGLPIELVLSIDADVELVRTGDE